MPLTFNETVPTITDLLEYCGVDEKEIQRFITDDFIYDFIHEDDYRKDAIYPQDIVLISIDQLICNIKTNITREINKSIPHETLDAFRKSTNSQYIAWC